MPEYQPVDIPANAPYVNALFLRLVRGIEDVLGPNGRNAVLRSSGLGRFISNPPANDLGSDVLAREYARLNQAVEEFAGRAGRGMLQRIGRASFRWAIREQAAVMGLAGVALQVLPLKLRKRAVLLAIRKGLMDIVEYGLIHVAEKDGALIYTDYACTICHMRSNDRPVCHLYVGSLGEAMAFATGLDFRHFEVVETHCRAMGDAFCRFEIRDRQ